MTNPIDPELYPALAWALAVSDTKESELWQLVYRKYPDVLGPPIVQDQRATAHARAELEALVDSRVREAINEYDPDGLVQRGHDYWVDFQPPELPEADRNAHAAARERVRRMSPEEKRQMFIDAGIYDQDGALTEAYGGEPVEPLRSQQVTEEHPLTKSSAPEFRGLWEECSKASEAVAKWPGWKRGELPEPIRITGDRVEVDDGE